MRNRTRLEIELPVNIPGVKLTGAHGGAVAPGGNAAFDVTFPSNVQPGSRSLSLQVAPFHCGVAVRSAGVPDDLPLWMRRAGPCPVFLPNIIVENTVRELGLNANLDEHALQEKISSGLERLYAFQHKDGGWGWWKPTRRIPL